MMIAVSLISLVDDDQSVRESLPGLLMQLGYAVRAFAAADEFLASDAVEQTRCLIAASRSTDPDHFHHRPIERDSARKAACARGNRFPGQAFQRYDSSRGAR